MANHKTKLELTWIGKEHRPRLEPRILIKDPAKPHHQRRELFDAQDAIDAPRGELIGRIEKQLRQRHTLKPLFAFRWRLA